MCFRIGSENDDFIFDGIKLPKLVLLAVKIFQLQVCLTMRDL